MGELAAECCCTQEGLRALLQDGRLLLGPKSKCQQVESSDQTT